MIAQRHLTAFQGPDSGSSDEPDNVSAAYEAAWDQFVDTLHAHGFSIVNDLDPVAVVGVIEVYEVEPLRAEPEHPLVLAAERVVSDAWRRSLSGALSRSLLGHGERAWPSKERGLAIAVQAKRGVKA